MSNIWRLQLQLETQLLRLSCHQLLLKRLLAQRRSIEHRLDLVGTDRRRQNT